MLLQKSRRRGPDDSGSVFLDNQIYLGSNRLQIIGSPGHGRMPFQSLNGECWIVFNGERLKMNQFIERYTIKTTAPFEK